jgi:streptogramin lyase
MDHQERRLHMFSQQKESKTWSVACGNLLLSFVLSLLLAACSMPSQNGLAHFREFPLPPGSYLGALAAGPDGNVWFTVPAVAAGEEKIGKITPSGVITEYPLPTHNSYLQGITAGHDGNVWFTEYEGNKIGRITPSGTITEFPLPASSRMPRVIVVGPDDNLWFAEGDKIGKITPDGRITEFPTARNVDPYGITAGPDGNLWFTGVNGNTIGRITPQGKITTFPLPTAGAGAKFITSGPDGNLWFSENAANEIGRITPTGTITEFPIVQGDSPWDITTGPDGNLWILQEGTVLRITPSGTMMTFSKPNADYYMGGYGGYITVGPDGNIWFTGGLPESPPRLCRFSPNQ